MSARLTAADITEGATITLYSGARGAELVTIDEVSAAGVRWHYLGSSEIQTSWMLNLIDGTDPALAAFGNAIEMRRAF